MRLNPISPSDNPMEQLLYCFGGGDSGGSDSGGSSRGTTTSSRGSSGGTRGRSRGNDSSRDSLGDSSISSGYGGYDGGGGGDNDRPSRATPAPAPAVNPGNIGVGSGASLGATSNQNFAARGPSTGGGSDRNFYADPAGAPSYPTAPDYSNTGAIAAPGFAPPSFSSTVDVADLDAMAEVQDALAAGGRSDITSGEQTGTMDLSTMIDPSNELDPFGDGFLSPEEMAAIEAAEAATNARAAALAMPSLDISKTSPQATAPGPRTTPTQAQPDITPDITVSVPRGIESLGVTPNPIESQIGVTRALDNLSAQAEDERPFTPLENPEIFGIEVPSLLVAGANLIGGAVNAADKYAGGNIPGYAQDVMNRPGGAPVMANAPMMSPAEPSAFQQELMAAGPQPLGPYSEAQGVPDVLGGFGPNQLSFIPGQPDNIYVGDPRGVETAQMLDPDVQVLDEDYFAQGRDQEPRGNDGQAAPEPIVLPDPVTEECPAGYVRDGSGACVYQGQEVVRGGQYTPRAAPTINYTGIPSLAPFTLRPTARPAPQAVDPFALLRSPRS